MTPVSGIFTAGFRLHGRDDHEHDGSCQDGGARLAMIALAATAMMLASDSILILSGWCRTFLAFMTFGASLSISSTTWAKSRTAGFTLLCLSLGCTWLALRLDSVAMRLVLLAWTLLLAEILREIAGRRPPSPGGVSAAAPVAWAGLGFACLLLCYQRSDSLWFLIKRIGGLGPGRAPVGIWISAFPVYVFGLLSILPGLLTESGRRRTLLCAVTLVAGFAIGRALIPALAPVTPLRVSLIHGASVLVVSLVVWRAPMAVRDLRTLFSLSAGLTILAAGCVAWLHLPSIGMQPERPVDQPCGSSTALYSGGLLDWRRPDMEHVGITASGMFGLFRDELERDAIFRGGCVVLADSITEDLVADVGTLVFINPRRSPTEREVRRIERFVRDGGGLLVLGDHTDIEGTRAPLNTVLGFTKIRFNFDSAIPLRKGWRGCLEVRPHPATEAYSGNEMLQIAVGASLDIKSPARPVIIGRYGFSDAGDPSNGGVWAFMGDMTHEPAEQVGDLVLAAAQDLGRGRVLVLGDTSPFQNGALFLSRGFVQNVMAWLSAGIGDRTRDGIGQDASSGCVGRLEPVNCPDSVSCPTAIVDFSLKPMASLALFDDCSLGGLANCLARVGVVAVPARARCDWTSNAACIFLVSPTEALGAADVAWLLHYMTSGGHVILSEGYACPQPGAGLLARTGFRIRPIPLGGGLSGGVDEPAGRHDAAPIRHKEAWALTCEDTSGALVRARLLGYPTIASRKVGAGSFTLIGDGRFLMDKNLESELRGNLDNIIFVTSLIRELERPGACVSASRN